MERGEGSQGKWSIDAGEDALPAAKNQQTHFRNDPCVKSEAAAPSGERSQRMPSPASVCSHTPRQERQRMLIPERQSVAPILRPIAPRPADASRTGSNFVANEAARRVPIVDYELVAEMNSGMHQPYTRIELPVARTHMHQMFASVVPLVDFQPGPAFMLVVPIVMEIPIRYALAPQEQQGQIDPPLRPQQVHRMPLNLQQYLEHQVRQQMDQELHQIHQVRQQIDQDQQSMEQQVHAEQQRMQQQVYREQQQMQQQVHQEQQQVQQQMHPAPLWPEHLNEAVAVVE